MPSLFFFVLSRSPTATNATHIRAIYVASGHIGLAKCVYIFTATNTHVKHEGHVSKLVNWSAACVHILHCGPRIWTRSHIRCTILVPPSTRP